MQSILFADMRFMRGLGELALAIFLGFVFSMALVGAALLLWYFTHRP